MAERRSLSRSFTAWRKRTFSLMPACAPSSPFRSVTSRQHNAARRGSFDRVSDLIEELSMALGLAWWSMSVVVPCLMASTRQTGAIFHIHVEQGPIKPPPKSFQNVGKSMGAGPGISHAAGECAVEMRVGTDVAGHHQLPARVSWSASGYSREDSRRDRYRGCGRCEATGRCPQESRLGCSRVPGGRCKSGGQS